MMAPSSAISEALGDGKLEGGDSVLNFFTLKSIDDHNNITICLISLQ